MKTENLDLRLMDCMDLMREYPDNHFDLAVVVSDTPETDEQSFTYQTACLNAPPADYLMVRAAHAMKMERERNEARDIAHDLAVELYSSQHIPEASNASRLIKTAMSFPPNA